MRKRSVGILGVCALVAGLFVGLQGTSAEAAYPVTQAMYGHQWGTTSSTTVWAQISCPAGRYATGGGGENDMNDPHNWILQESSPLLDSGIPRGWRVQYRNLNGSPINVSYDIVVYAICTT
jgi:hypothetical protein